MEYLTKTEAAKYLRISTRTLDRLIAAGEITPARVGERRLILKKGALDAYVERQIGAASR